MAKVSFLMFLGILLSVLGMCLHMAGIATPEWAFGKETSQGVDFNFGLFRVCVENAGCASLDNITGAQRTVQALAIMACIVGATGIAFAIAYTVMCIIDKHPTRIIRLVGFMCCLIAKGLIFGGLIIFRIRIFQKLDDNRYSKDMDIGYSFVLSCLGGVAFLIGGILMLLSRGHLVERYTS